MRLPASLLALAVAAAAVVSGQSEVAPSGAPVNPICAIALRVAAQAALPEPTPVGIPEPGASVGLEPAASGSTTDAARLEALDQAVRACASIEDWDAAAALYPEAFAGGEPRAVLAERCADPSAGLSAYATCRSFARSLVTPPPTEAPTAGPGSSPGTSTAGGALVDLPLIRTHVPGASRVRPFEISGQTPEELMADMLAQSAAHCGAHAFACTEVSPGVRPRLVLRGDQCRVASVRIDLRTTVHAPRWTSPRRVPAELVAWYRLVNAYIERHEGRHISITKSELAKLRRRVVGRQCSRVVPAMQRFNAAVWRGHERLDRNAATLFWVPPYDGRRPGSSPTPEP
jgi:predicted secreted Zn-dependent protease